VETGKGDFGGTKKENDMTKRVLNDVMWAAGLMVIVFYAVVVLSYGLPLF